MSDTHSPGRKTVQLMLCLNPDPGWPFAILRAGPLVKETNVGREGSKRATTEIGDGKFVFARFETGT